MIRPDFPGMNCEFDVTSLAEDAEVRQKVAFRRLAINLDALWAYGSGVLVMSLNRRPWKNMSDKLGLRGSFSVSAVVSDQRGAFVFSRSGEGLLCSYLAGFGENCISLPRIPTGSPRILAQRVVGSLIVCVNEDGCATFYKLRDASSAWVQLPMPLPGIAVHFTMTDSGVGMCALWGIEREGGIAKPGPSAVYGTHDGGISWNKVQEMDTMLLGGSSVPDGSTLLGGTAGFIAEGTVEGFNECHPRCIEEVAAVSSDPAQQSAILGTLDEHPRQSLLWRSYSSKWNRFEVGLVDRVVDLRLVGFGKVLLCTSENLFSYRVEVVQ